MAAPGVTALVADHVHHLRGAVGPAEAGPLPGQAEAGPLRATRMLAAPVAHIHLALLLVGAAELRLLPLGERDRHVSYWGCDTRKRKRKSTNAAEVRRSCRSEGRRARAGGSVRCRAQGGKFIDLQTEKQNKYHLSALKARKLKNTLHSWLAEGGRAVWGGASGAYDVHRAGQDGSAFRRAHPGKTATGCPRQTSVS